MIYEYIEGLVNIKAGFFANKYCIIRSAVVSRTSSGYKVTIEKYRRLNKNDVEVTSYAYTSSSATFNVIADLEIYVNIFGRRCMCTELCRENGSTQKISTTHNLTLFPQCFVFNGVYGDVILHKKLDVLHMKRIDEKVVELLNSVECSSKTEHRLLNKIDVVEKDIVCHGQMINDALLVDKKNERMYGRWGPFFFQGKIKQNVIGDVSIMDCTLYFPARQHNLKGEKRLLSLINELTIDSCIPNKKLSDKWKLCVNGCAVTMITDNMALTANEEDISISFSCHPMIITDEYTTTAADRPILSHKCVCKGHVYLFRTPLEFVTAVECEKTDRVQTIEDRITAFVKNSLACKDDDRF